MTITIIVGIACLSLGVWLAHWGGRKQREQLQADNKILADSNLELIALLLQAQLAIRDSERQWQKMQRAVYGKAVAGPEKKKETRH